MGIGGFESESSIPKTYKRAYYLSTTSLPLPREAPFPGQNREGRGADWVKGLGPVPKRTIPHDWVEVMDWYDWAVDLKKREAK